MSRTLLRSIFCCPCCDSSSYSAVELDGSDEPTLELSLEAEPTRTSGKGAGAPGPKEVGAFEIEIDGEEEGEAEDDAFMAELARDEVLEREEDDDHDRTTRRTSQQRRTESTRVGLIAAAAASSKAREAEEELKEYLEGSASPLTVAPPSLPPYTPIAAPVSIPTASHSSASSTPRAPAATAAVAASSNGRSARSTPKVGSPSPLQPPPAYNFPSAPAAASIIHPGSNDATFIAMSSASLVATVDGATELLDTSITTADLEMSPLENDAQSADILRFSQVLEAQAIESRKKREATAALPSPTATTTHPLSHFNAFTPSSAAPPRTIVPKVHRGGASSMATPAPTPAGLAEANSSFAHQEGKESRPADAGEEEAIASTSSSIGPTSTAAEAPTTKKQLQPSSAEQVRQHHRQQHEQQPHPAASTAAPAPPSSVAASAADPFHPPAHPHHIAHWPSAPALNDVAALEAFPTTTTTTTRKPRGSATAVAHDTAVAAAGGSTTSTPPASAASSATSGSSASPAKHPPAKAFTGNPLDSLGVPAGTISGAHMSALMSALQSSTSSLAAVVSYAHLFAFLHGKDRSLSGQVLRPFVLPELEAIVKAHFHATTNAADAASGGGHHGKPPLKRSASATASDMAAASSVSSASGAGAAAASPAVPPKSSLHPEAAKLLVQFLHWLVDVRVERPPAGSGQSSLQQHAMVLRFAFPNGAPKYHYIDQPSQDTWVLASTHRADPFAVHPGNQPAVYRNESNKLCLHRELHLTCDAKGVVSLRSGDVSVKKSFLSLNCDLRTEFRPGMVEYDDRKRAFIQMREDDDTKPVILDGRYQPRCFDYWLVVKVLTVENWIGLPTIGQAHPPNLKMKPHEGYAYP